jgi:hypothetical protein
MCERDIELDTTRAAIVQRHRCEMCLDGKWRSVCPECDGLGYYVLDEESDDA